MQVAWDQTTLNRVSVVQKNSDELLIIDIRKPNQVQTTLKH